MTDTFQTIDQGNVEAILCQVIFRVCLQFLFYYIAGTLGFTCIMAVMVSRFFAWAVVWLFVLSKCGFAVVAFLPGRNRTV
jgi:hypothetical protein